MKKSLLIFSALFCAVQIQAQNVVEIITPDPYYSGVITTGVPFLLIAADARGAALGDMGVATSVDPFSQQWNASKYAFSETKQGVGLSYTPYLSKLVNDISLSSINYFNRLNERSAFAASFRYFGLGEIEFVEDENQTPYIVKPNEFALDVSYALRLSDEFSMAVVMRYVNSDLKIPNANTDTSPASTFNVDITGFYQSEEQAYNSFNGRYRFGFAIQNIGPTFKYDEGGQENFQPTNLRLGAGFDFILDDYNKVTLTTEFTKLLVPTPPLTGNVLVFDDVNGDGEYDVADGDILISDTDNVILEGKSNDVGFMKGMFQSFGDAPGGFSEEMQEWTWAIGAEYYYQDSFAFRAGYFHESPDKGARQFFAIGAGFKYNVIGLDLSYLFSASKIPSPLENTLRFSLTFNIDREAYREY
ncbi:type IX secretion system outer membrane channel protein PorV [Bizionia arctica]|uniref:Type IX secretion system protein PorV domain-containing protein n=1 Tax=Bizionia arctica TaxID=1495645 RepID=A0A917GRE9_9FLAO|nr:type IX secretion system outer membrane channel protein PorV [Bizionia arctica]GGG55222.1 hypothetical protein GCM10010976_27620 [Bizionia arctica]